MRLRFQPLLTFAMSWFCLKENKERNCRKGNLSENIALIPQEAALSETIYCSCADAAALPLIITFAVHKHPFSTLQRLDLKKTYLIACSWTLEDPDLAFMTFQQVLPASYHILLFVMNIFSLNKPSNVSNIYSIHKQNVSFDVSFQSLSHHNGHMMWRSEIMKISRFVQNRSWLQ